MTSGSNARKIRAVIVEDELIAAEYLREILERNGAEVVDIVDTGKAAVEVCLAERPDIVFMDIMLRDSMSGSEAALAVSRRLKETKIVFLTAYADPEMIDFAVESNAAGYLSKPYNEAEIVATMRLALARRETAAAEKTEAAEPERKTPDTIDLVDGYVYDTVHGRLLREGREVELGPKALKLIALLVKTPDLSVSNEQISMHVWGELVNDRTLRSLMFRIRHATSEALIKNVSGTGYMIRSAAKAERQNSR